MKKVTKKAFYIYFVY